MNHLSFFQKVAIEAEKLARDYEKYPLLSKIMQKQEVQREKSI